MALTTKVGDENVEVLHGDLIVVYFSGGLNGKDDAGNWEFWTAVRLKGEGIIPGAVTVRCRPGSDPGQRFREQEGRPKEAVGWEFALNANEIRPADTNRFYHWLKMHPEDAPFAEYAMVGAFLYVEKGGGKYQFVTKEPRVR